MRYKRRLEILADMINTNETFLKLALEDFMKEREELIEYRKGREARIKELEKEKE